MKNNLITPPSWKGVFFNLEIKNQNAVVDNNWHKKIKTEILKIKNNKSFDFLQHRFSKINMIYSIYRINSIVDIGGANGWSYYYLKKFSKINNLKKFIVFETKPIVNIMKKIPLAKKIKFDYNINKIGKFDLLYSNSTFQYILDDELIKHYINKCDPKYILLEDLLIGNFRDFFTNQIYYDKNIKVKFRNEKKFIKLFEKMNYEVIFTENYISKHRGIFQKLPMNGFSKKYKIDYSKSIFFKKK